jgi:hypothetical protein
MKNIHPLRTARRKIKRQTEPPKPRRDTRSGLEWEHAAGFFHDQHLVAPVCLLCQDLVTEHRRDADVSMNFEPNRLKRYGLKLKALAVFLRMLSDAVWRWGCTLVEMSEGENNDKQRETRNASS